MLMRTYAAGFLIATLYWQSIIGDGDIWCRWNTTCILEAKFPIGGDIVVHWRHGSVKKVYVHSFYHEADQLANQNERYRGRTSLLKEKIKDGSASLMLKNVVIGDEGRYEYYVGTVTHTTESFVRLHVEAPVTTIQIQELDNKQLICSSEGIFPKPELSWSTEPVLAQALSNDSNILQDTRTKLYSIDSSFDLLDDMEYICDISGLNNSRRATWKKTNLSISHSVKRIECAPVTNDSSLLWTYNYSDVIASRHAGQIYTITDNWMKYVKDVLEDGSLRLQDLTPDQNGIYTCTLSNATQTRFNVVFLRVTEHGYPKAVRVELLVLAALLSVVLPCIMYCLWKKCKCCHCDPNSSQSEGVL